MNIGQSKAIRTRLLATFGALGLAAGLVVVGANPAWADDCVVSAGVTQNGNTIEGTGGPDTIDCSQATHEHVIRGNGGNDTIAGSPFNDKIGGGGGKDTIRGRGGADSISGGPGFDTLHGGAGNDTIGGGPGGDFLYGDEGDDDLVGPHDDGSVDTMNGGSGVNTCSPINPDGDSAAFCT